MTELDRLAGYIIGNGSVVASYTAIDAENKPVHAFEVNFENNVLLLIFDSREHCTGIIRK
ncbi:MAG: hypothetical protein NC177_03290 [Ruminococcus flavefaciens]|nr:hypothetical protein [Ruminococcus flavefaciens]